MTPPNKTTLLLTMLLLTACMGARFQAYWKIDQPLYNAIEELHKHPGNTNAQQALPVLYQQAVRRHETNILLERFSVHPTRYDKILARLEALQHIYNTLQSVPAAFAIVKPKKYAFEAGRTEEELSAFLGEVLKTDFTEYELQQILEKKQ